MADHNQHSDYSSINSQEDSDIGDIWDDEDNVSYDRTIAERDWTRMNDTFGNSGYREGIEEGKEGTLQQGFNQGWGEGTYYGYELGRLRGLISPLIEYFKTISSSAQSPNTSTGSNTLLSSINDKEAWIEKASTFVKELTELDIDKVFDKAFFDDGQPSKSSTDKSTGCCGSSSSKSDSCCKKDKEDATQNHSISDTVSSSPTDGCCSSKNKSGSVGCCSKQKNIGSEVNDEESMLSKPEKVIGVYQHRARELLKEIGLENILSPA